LLFLLIHQLSDSRRLAWILHRLNPFVFPGALYAYPDPSPSPPHRHHPKLSRELTVDQIHEALHEAASGRMQGVLRVTDEALVSRDIIGDPHSPIVESASTLLPDDWVDKIVAWYDNESGFQHERSTSPRSWTSS
jgi:hypothetical protein